MEQPDLNNNDDLSIESLKSPMGSFIPGISEIDPHSRIERQRISDLDKELAREGCLHEIFEATVDKQPHALAMICNNQSWTYAELDRRANQLAHLIRFYEIKPGQLVGLYFERNYHPIISILACLKAGVGYLPIDPILPLDRIRHMLEESETTLLLTDTVYEAKSKELYSASQGNILVIDTLDQEIDKFPVTRLSRAETGVKPSDLCYVLYTSGTTGRPKGVMCQHINAFRYVHAFNDKCRTTPLDRVFQGFSLSFDGSVEEIWMAFSNGSTLVVGTKDTPKFGDDLARFLNDNKITYFSTVPTLMSTIAVELPWLRYLIVSGEACPRELVDRWAHGNLEVLNVYGPTEATVNTTIARCSPDDEINIGFPLRGYHLYILDENGVPVKEGEKGELYVGGETLARGYLKQPELTAQKFVMQSPFPGAPVQRLYRTGDLVRRNQKGELEFFGRMDGQIKIRGFRVELSEIESVLREHSQIRSAVVKLHTVEQLSQLVAYVVLEPEIKALDSNDVLTLLHQRLPDYMVPGYLDVLPELPTLASGKVDRSRLPLPKTPLLRSDVEILAPTNELELKLHEAWTKVFKVPKVSIESDFFRDMGGHSLLAAQMVTFLRNRYDLDVAIRDAYRFPTIKLLATLIAERLAAKSANANDPLKASGEGLGKTKTSREVFHSLSATTRRMTAALQALSIYGIYGIRSIPALASLLIIWKAYLGLVSIKAAVALVLFISFGLWPLFLGFAVASKWILIGRYKEGSYPLWGSYFFRWWLVNRLQGFSGASALSGTPLAGVYYRLMGAKVGRDCSIDSMAVSCWDMITLGDDTSIGADSQLLGYRIEDGLLKIGRVTIGSRNFIGLHSAVGLNVVTGDDCSLDDQSFLPDWTVVRQGEGRRGSPAQAAEVKLPQGKKEIPSFSKKFGYAMAHLVLTYAMGFVTLPFALLFFAVSLYTFWKWGIVAGIAAEFLLVPAGVLFSCFYIAALKRLILNKAKPGVYSLYSLFYLRKWLADGIIRSSRAVLLPLYTTLYLPPWLRLLGAKIGPRAELSTVWYFSPEMLEVEGESFFADGCIIGGRRTHMGLFEVGINHVGKRSFVGNSAILPMGSGLGNNCLLGVLSAPPVGSQCTPEGTEWLGCPAFALPNRLKVWNFNEEVTYKPSTKLYIQRGIIDFLRILIPGILLLTSGIAGIFAMGLIYWKLGLTALFLAAPGISLLLGILLSLIVVIIKWTVMGTFKPVTVPLWSPYVWLNEMVNGIYESVMNPAMSPFLGTPFLAPFLRAIGCKVGKNTYIDSTLFSEWDLVEIGDYASLNLGAIIQTHLFEDRVMKSSYLKIGESCSVGNMAVVLYDTEMETGSSLSTLSLLMKGETLKPMTRWHGIPTVQIEHEVL